MKRLKIAAVVLVAAGLIFVIAAPLLTLTVRVAMPAGMPDPGPSPASAVTTAIFMVAIGLIGLVGWVSWQVIKRIQVKT